MSLSSFAKFVPALLNPARTGLQALAAALTRPQPTVAGQLLLPAGETPASESFARTRRLLVLVPEELPVPVEVAQRAWTLAAPRGLPVVYVARAPDGEQEPQVRRQLAGLAALTRDEGVAVTTRVARVPHWLPAVQTLWQPGDLVVVFTGQVVPAGWLGLGRQALDRALLQGLRVPIYQANLLEKPARIGRRLARPLEQVLSLMMPLVFIASFFFLQVTVQRLAHGVAATVLLCVCVLAEFGLLWLLERLLANQ